MSTFLSPNTQSILLLTAPLIAGREDTSSGLLTHGEYKRLSRFLRENGRQPAELLDPDAAAILKECSHFIPDDRLKTLLGRGFLLTQAAERWQSRAIWVASHTDREYPRRLIQRLADSAPPVIYGCGNAAILETGGLAVVGSRNADDLLIEYTERVGRLTAESDHTLVSGGARGIDQAAMRGALEYGGKAAAVLADSLERAALNRENRELLIAGRLTLMSPYDPAAGFNVGHAMQRNKLIYALADAALVVSSDYEKGGTWAGAIEQVEKLRLVPVYVRMNGARANGLSELHRRGALAWPEPQTPAALRDLLSIEPARDETALEQQQLFPGIREEDGRTHQHSRPLASVSDNASPDASESPQTPAEELFAKVRDLLGRMTTARTEAEVAAELDVSRNQARDWLQRLVEEGVLEKLARPVRYRAKPSAGGPAGSPTELFR